MADSSDSFNESILRNIFFGNYMEPDADPKVYDEVTDMDLLETKIQYYLNEYNLLSKTPMNIVMFKYAVEHISRVSRILQQDSGHALLVGIGGSGRNSATKMAASMADYELYQVRK